jgi:hypothetical protein
MTISIQLDAEIQQRLNKLVALTGRTKSDLLDGLIQSGLDDLELLEEKLLRYSLFLLVVLTYGLTLNLLACQIANKYLYA